MTKNRNYNLKNNNSLNSSNIKFNRNLNINTNTNANANVNDLYDIYLKSELNRLTKNAKAYLKAVMVFPNYYGVAMSNLGFLKAYELINKSEFISCDRAFLQNDLSKGIISIETRKRLINYDIIFFSLSYENDFSNILSILLAEKIPFLSNQRDDSLPLIAAGGVIAFLNPEPVAPIFDVMFVGEAEAIFPDFFKNLENKNIKNKQEILESSAQINGIYVPKAYNFIFDQKKINVLNKIEHLPGFPEKIVRKYADKDSVFSSSAITTRFSELSNINMIEIERGCKRGCRFCSAGFIYLPLRESKPDDVFKAVKSMSENEKAGFVGLGTMDSKNINKIMQYSVKSKKPFSLSSIRFDCLDENNLDLIKETGIKTLTLGIETGSSRLKKMLNKDIDNDEIITVLKNVIRKGIINIKSYFMFGLPYENEEDLNDSINLVKMMQKEFVAVSKANKRIGLLTVSFSPFVPKPWTPLQWENFEEPSTLRQKANYISYNLKGLPNLSVNINNLNAAFIEAFFARGSRISNELLIYSFNNKINLKNAVAAKGYDIKDFIRKFEKEELLPWDIIDQGITKKYLLEEYLRAINFKTTPQCFEGCKRCGVCS